MSKGKVVPSSYQELKTELESVMNRLQAEDLDVDEALRLYQRGLELVQQLDTYLKTAKNNIQELKAKFDKGSE